MDVAYRQIIAPAPSAFPEIAIVNDLPTPESGEVDAAYLHIPFCRTHCRYCDFAVAVGTPELMEKYIQFLVREIALIPGPRPTLKTIYFGGGTPSLLSADQLGRILATLDQCFDLAPDAEVSLEANPGTFDGAKLLDYRALGVNRLSLGVQAFQDRLLALCGRSHDTAAVYRSIETVRQSGFDNFNLDLIFGLPEQTVADWEATLGAVVAAEPAHISLYDLILEEETLFGRTYRPDVSPLPSEEDTVEMYLRAIDALSEAGLAQYEIANFARPGRQCAHNRVYWRNRPYLAFGLGATSYLERRRFERPRRLFDYFRWVEAGCPVMAEPVCQAEELSDTLLFGLRLLEGVEVASLQVRFGQEAISALMETLAPAFSNGRLRLTQGHLRLAVPEGLLFSNEIFTLLV